MRENVSKVTLSPLRDSDVHTHISASTSLNSGFYANKKFDINNLLYELI